MNINVFDLIGPIMVGPSSSHTAGAVNMGRVALMLLKEKVKYAKITLHGSFAYTHKGHGTDKALIAGLLGFLPEDERIRESDKYAEEEGMSVVFITENLGSEHPNTARMDLIGVDGGKVVVQCASIGGGNIIVTMIDDAEVNFSCKYFTLVGELEDKPGMVGATTSIIGKRGINIAGVRAFRKMKKQSEILVIETDQRIPEDAIDEMRSIPGVLNITVVDRL